MNTSTGCNCDSGYRYSRPSEQQGCYLIPVYEYQIPPWLFWLSVVGVPFMCLVCCIVGFFGWTVRRQILATKCLRDDIEGFVKQYAQANENMELDTMEINADLCMPMSDLETRPMIDYGEIQAQPVIDCQEFPVESVEPDLPDWDDGDPDVPREEKIMRALSSHTVAQLDLPVLPPAPPHIEYDWRRMRVKDSISKRLLKTADTIEAGPVGLNEPEHDDDDEHVVGV